MIICCQTRHTSNEDGLGIAFFEVGADRLYTTLGLSTEAIDLLIEGVGQTPKTCDFVLRSSLGESHVVSDGEEIQITPLRRNDGTLLESHTTLALTNGEYVTFVENYEKGNIPSNDHLKDWFHNRKAQFLQLTEPHLISD